MNCDLLLVSYGHSMHLCRLVWFIDGVAAACGSGAGDLVPMAFAI